MIAVIGADAGRDDVAGLRLATAGAGLEVRPSTMMAIAALAIGMAAWGSTGDAGPVWRRLR